MQFDNLLDEKELSKAILDNDNIKAKMQSLARVAFNAELDTLSIDQVRTAILMDMACMPIKYTISAGSKRKTEVQYSTNDYYVAEEVDCSAYATVVQGVLDRSTSVEEMLTKYFDIKVAFLNLMKAKIGSKEELLRTMLREYEAKDGIPGQGRYSLSK